MKIGVTYLYTISKFGYPPEFKDEIKAFKELSEMGFHFLEMEGLGQHHSENVWKNRAEYKKYLDEYGIHVHNFCGVDPDLTSMDNQKRKSAYERFKKTAELAVFLGAETIHLASYAPPVKYIGRSPYKLGEAYSLGDIFRVEIPDDFSWEQVWNILVESCRFTADVADQYERTVIMEPRVGELVSSVDSMLRLIENVDRKNFKANIDTGHFSAQRENVPLSLMKLRNKFANIHIADNNPESTNHLPIGKGIIDWYEFFRILKLMNYNDYLGLDLSNSKSLAMDLKDSLDYILEISKQLNFNIEW